MASAEDDALNQPVTRWHEIRKVLDHATITLAVVLERQKGHSDQFAELKTLATAIHTRIDRIDARQASLEHKLVAFEAEFSPVKRGIDEINARQVTLDNKFVAFEAEFTPVKRVVYGMVALILVGVFGALVALVIKQ